MNTIQRIAKNTTAMLLSNVIGKVIGFLCLMYTSRYLGPLYFGVLCFAFAFSGIFSIFINFGFQHLIVREVARNNSLASKYLRNVGCMKIFLATLVISVTAITINLLGYSYEKTNAVLLITFCVIIDSFSTMIYSIFRAFQKMEYELVAKLFHSLLVLTGILFAIKLKSDLLGFALVYPITSIISLGFNMAIIKRKLNDVFYQWIVNRIIEIDMDFWKQTIRMITPFGLSSIFVTIYFWIDTVMLSAIKGDTEVGWYNSGYRLMSVLLFIPGAYFMSVYPVISQFYESSRKSLEFVFSQSVKYMFLIALPIAVGTTMLASKIILFVYNPEYLPAVPALQIVIWAMFFSYMSHVPMYIFNSTNKQTIYTYIVFFSLVINIFASE